MDILLNQQFVSTGRFFFYLPELCTQITADYYLNFKGNTYVNLIVVVYYDRQERRLCAHPFLEIYREGQIHFMAPLARQGDFYVPEVRRVERRLLEQEELHSDSDGSGTCTSCCTAW